MLRREQLLSKYRKTGLEGLSESERLELLLIYARCSDAASLAAELLGDYGSINALVNADSQLLVKNSRVSEQTAVLLRLISCISRALYMERFTVKTIKNAEAVKKFFNSHFIGAVGEKLIMTAVSKNFRVYGSKVLALGSQTSAAVTCRDIADLVVHTECTIFFTAHNHPCSPSAPSESDMLFTRKVAGLLSMLGAVLADHIIIGTDGAFSFRENGLVPEPLEGYSTESKGNK